MLWHHTCPTRDDESTFHLLIMTSNDQPKIKHSFISWNKNDLFLVINEQLYTVLSRCTQQGISCPCSQTLRMYSLNVQTSRYPLINSLHGILLSYILSLHNVSPQLFWFLHCLSGTSNRKSRNSTVYDWQCSVILLTLNYTRLVYM